MAPSTVRPATAADSRTVADLQLQVWGQAFATVLPPTTLHTDPVAHAQAWAERIEHGGPVLLALEGAEAVGFAAVGAAAEQRNLLDPVGEIEVLYVVPRWGRRGHGGRLLVAAATELRRLGTRSGRWWILQADSVTARFLTASGWVEDGVRRELDTGATPIVELRWSGTLDLIAV